jgi:Histidine kinase-, DNA gyrase B-, and HSP90-like ATPase
VRTGRLRAADPFELIRWLARSQTDPRKALAELVQNSLDAGARHVTVTRVRERGVTALRVRDDGEGVIPEMARGEALAHVATHIGHSRKRNLTPEQRRELLLQGQYGIGLLGFWAIGAELEMRSQVTGAEPWALRMWEEKPSFEVAPLRGRLGLESGTWTEVVVRRLHRPALVGLTGRRIADYLAGELRGQLLARAVEVTIHDRMARGTAQKVRRVEPVRFPGARLPLPHELPVAGHPPARVELYLAPEDREPPRVSVSCGGTVVYDDLGDAFDGRFRREPWTASRLGGLLEFPGFAVAPGSRRGVLLDDAAEAFAAVVERDLEALVRAALALDAQQRAQALEADVVQKLQRAFRDLPREAPEYDLFAVRAPVSPSGASPAPGGVAETGAVAARPVVDEPEEPEGPPTLLPPGPLARVEIRPARVRVERLGRRGLRARATDASGVRITEGVTYRWTVADGVATLESAEGAATVLVAGPESGRVRVEVTAHSDGREVGAETDVTVVDALPESGPRAGIPEPAFVDDPRGEWRSRLVDGRWEVNGAHRDFVAAAAGPRRKLRYLAALLAKEVVIHSFPLPQGGTLLERLVSILALAEPRLERG